MGIWWIILVTAIAGVLGTGLGGLVGAILKHDSTKIVSLLLAFAGGVMMAVVCFDLFPGAMNPETGGTQTPIWIVLLGAVVGYFAVYFLNALIDKKTNPEVHHIDEEHPQTADDLDELIHADHYNLHASQEEKSSRDLFVAGLVMAFAIALHNVPEGMVIGATYAADAMGISGGAGLVMAIVIGLHNIPEGMAVSVPLISGGMKKNKAVLITALSGAPTILGAILGFSLGMIGPVWLAVLLAFAGGAMLYVVFGELFPESFLMWKSKAPGAAALLGTLVGLILVFT